MVKGCRQWTVTATSLTRRWPVRAGAACLAGFQKEPSAKAQNPQRAGTVDLVKGECFAETGSAHRSLAKDDSVFILDHVGTGPDSRLTVHLGQNTRVRLGERARITIDRYLVNSGGELTLDSGPMFFERPPRGRPLPVRIRSAFGLLAVRGTRFFAGPSAGVFGVFVERGEVTVTASGKRVTVQKGQGTNIAHLGMLQRNRKSGARSAFAMRSIQCYLMSSGRDCWLNRTLRYVRQR